MRSGVLVLAALAALAFAAGDASACHRGKSAGCASGSCAGGCGGATCGGPSGCSGGSCPTGGCVAGGQCAWQQIEADGWAWVDGSGRQLGAYRPSTGLYTPYLGRGEWGAEVVLSEPTGPQTAVAAK